LVVIGEALATKQSIAAQRTMDFESVSRQGIARPEKSTARRATIVGWVEPFAKPITVV
jgi:hypothetical protein